MRISPLRTSKLLVATVSILLSAGSSVVAVQAASEKKESATVPVALEDGKAALTPKNTTIQFVGKHTGAEPNPRTGYFTRFKGVLAVDEASNAPAAAVVEIETASLITPINRLTGHLHSPDFFSVREFPKATFKSTKIEAVDPAAGKYKITGVLTIRDMKKSITLPAEVKVSDAGAVLASKFTLKRSEFGLSFGPDRIVEDVAMTVTVGRPTPKIEVE